MNDYYVDYGQGIKVLFHDVTTNSGIDMAMRCGFDIFPPEEKLIFAPPFIRKDDIVYDIGAYTLTHSVLFALYGAKVFAFEPSPFNYPRLVKNANWFNAHSQNAIKCFDIAFHEKEYDVTTQFKDCNNTLPDNNDVVQFIKYKVLDKFMADNNLPVPDFIKMDIEGAEIEAVRGSINTIKKFKPAFAIASYHIIKNKTTSVFLEDFFSRIGYNVKSDFSKHLTTYAWKN